MEIADDFIAKANISDLDQFNQVSKVGVSHPIYWSVVFKCVGFVFCAFTLVFGVFWNSVFISAVKRSTNVDQFLYKTLLSLCIADVILLVSSNIPHMTELFLALNEWIYGSAGCSIFIFVQYLSSCVVGLSVFTAAFYIFYSKLHPSLTITPKKGDIFTLVTWGIGAGFASPWLAASKTFFHQYQDGIIIEECRVGMTHSGFIAYYFIDSTVFCVVPCLGAICLVMSSIYRFKAVPVSEDNMKFNSDKQVLRMMLIMTVSYGFLNFPYRMFVLYNMLSPTPSYDMWLFLFLRVFIYFSCGIKPLVYFICNYLIRKTMISVMRCKKKEEAVELQMQTSALV